MSFTKLEAIRAAGGVVVRTNKKGSIEVLLVHRPGYEDWTFPKGKADPDERWRQTAYREVLEETGLSCRLDRKLGTVRYLDRKGRAKKVKYWLMTVLEGDFVPNDEVDAIQWCSLEAARRLLTYDRDRVLLDALAVPVAA